MLLVSNLRCYSIARNKHFLYAAKWKLDLSVSNFNELVTALNMLDASEIMDIINPAPDSTEVVPTESFLEWSPVVESI